MKREALNRERQICKLAKKNRWYQHERYKKYLGSQHREAETKALVKDLGI